MANEIKVGLVGAGWISGVHAEAWASVKGARLVAVADMIPDRARGFAEKYRLDQWYGSLEELLARPDIDAVDVCTPPSDHVETGLKVFAAGKHLSMQKPLTLTLRDTDLLTEAAAKAGKVLLPSYMYRYGPLTVKAQQLIAEGRIGKPQLAFHRMAIPRWRPSPWAWEASVSGGMVVEMLTHGFDLLIWCLGPATRVYAQGSCSGHKPGFNDNVSIIINHASGVTSVVQGSWCAPDNFPSHRIEIIGDTGAVHTEGGTFGTAPMYRLVHTDGKVATAWESMARGFVEKLQAFTDAARTNTEPSVTAADARAALEVALAAEQSIRTGLPVALPLTEE